MKLTALVTIFGLIATTAANPIPDADTAQLEGEHPSSPPRSSALVTGHHTNLFHVKY